MIVVLNGMGNAVLRMIGVNRRAQNAERAITFRRLDDISTRILVNGIPATLLAWQTEVHFRVIALTVGGGEVHRDRRACR